MNNQKLPKDPASEPIDVYFNSMIRQKNEEIARLKEENMILLKLTIKRAQEMDELKSKFEQLETAKHKSDVLHDIHPEGSAHMKNEAHHDRLELPIDFPKDKELAKDNSSEKIKATSSLPVDHPWDD